MRVRDAGDPDADAVAEVAGVPVAAARRLLRERTVRLAVEAADGEGDGVGEGDGDGEENDGNDTRDGDSAVPAAERVRGLVAFDAGAGAVHVTRLEGAAAVLPRLLDEPVRFAAGEGLTVEVVVPETGEAAQTAVERYGFTDAGPGPRFEGAATRRYRYAPASDE